MDIDNNFKKILKEILEIKNIIESETNKTLEYIHQTSEWLLNRLKEIQSKNNPVITNHEIVSQNTQFEKPIIDIANSIQGQFHCTQRSDNTFRIYHSKSKQTMFDHVGADVVIQCMAFLGFIDSQWPGRGQMPLQYGRVQKDYLCPSL